MLDSAGNAELRTYPRSAMKLVQVLPLLMSGAADALGITDPELALMCGSHNAEPRHLATAGAILDKAGATGSDLSCGTHPPLGERVHHALIATATPATALHNNCSGKHAGFLALAGWLWLLADGIWKKERTLALRRVSHAGLRIRRERARAHRAHRLA